MVPKKSLLPLLITLCVLAAIPLPFALVLTGLEGLLHGSAAAIKEFLVSYFFGLFTLLAGLGWYLWKNRDSSKE